MYKQRKNQVSVKKIADFLKWITKAE